MEAILGWISSMKIELKAPKTQVLDGIIKLVDPYFNVQDSYILY